MRYEVKLMSQTFIGGVHPDYMKAPQIPVTVIAPPPIVVIPMAQHIGAPAKPLVKKGDHVKMGQKIGENPAPVSAPVHASVSGKVVKIEKRLNNLGSMVDAVVIDLFAGSGALGIEALSRGAKKTYFCDASGQSIELLKKNVYFLENGSYEILKGDFTDCLRRLETRIQRVQFRQGVQGPL